MHKEPFNIEKFMAGQPALTRSGSTRYFVALDPKAIGAHQLIVRCGNGCIRMSYADGRVFPDTDNPNDLTHMASPYADFKIDEPVMVRDCESSCWYRGNFAGISETGLLKTWSLGTRWSSYGRTEEWREARRPTPEELEGGE